MQQNTKWTPEEDRKLQEAVKKHGTQWSLVWKEMNHARSQNAIIKRWHGYLKSGVNSDPFIPKPDTSEKNKDSKEEEKEKESQDQSESSSEKDQSEERIKTQRENHELIKKIMGQDYEYSKRWNSEDDTRLKDFIVRQGKFSWEELSSIFLTDEMQVKCRWIKEVYQRIKNTTKIGGAVKWSASEDSILYSADKNKVSYLDLMFFLPERTVYSIEARWRRIARNLDSIGHLDYISNRQSERKAALHKIAIKRHQQKQKVMQVIYDKEKQIIEKQKLEWQKYEMMRSKNRKAEKL